jgi:hypothetical protein
VSELCFAPQPTLQNAAERLRQHPLYRVLASADSLAPFMSHHVYAVWDFMSLLKALQRQLTCTELPWRPVGDPEIRYLINELVVAEESDLNRHGQRQSHFEMYLDAMRALGVSTAPVERFMARLQAGWPAAEALRQAGAPLACQRFVGFTLEVIARGAAHEIASVFAFGREDIIPEMFLEILAQTDLQGAEDLRYYLERHVVLDGDQHGPLARQMVSRLCGGDPHKLAEAEAIAEQALMERCLLWDAVVAAYGA